MRTFSDFKNVTVAEAKLTELKQQRDAIEKELSDKLAGVRPSAGTAVQQKAAAMLAGTPVIAGSDSAETKLRGNLAVIREAIRQQEKIVADARAVASVEIAKEALPGYTTQVLRIAKALTILNEVMRDEEAYRDKLIMEGVAFTNVFQPMAFKPHPNMDTSEFRECIAAWFKNGRELGYQV